MEIPRIIAHRGNRVRAPENTLLAFLSAAEVFRLRDVPGWVEFDAALTGEADKPAVVFHDARTAPLASGPDEALDEVGFADLRARLVGGEQIPTLDEAVFFCDKHALSMNIEIKINDPARAVQVAARVVEDLRAVRGEHLGRLLLSSFSVLALEEVRRRLPEVPRGLLWHEMAGDLSDALQRTAPSTLNPNQELLTGPEVVAAFQVHGLPLLTYTVNEPARARQLLGWGVQGVFTDDPAALLDALRGLI